jgi:CBS domain-containing protein
MTGAIQPTTVGDLMALDPIVVRANASLDEVAELLDRHHISGLPVVDGSGSLVGVVSQTDLVRARSTQYLWANWPGLAVRHLMTSPAVTVHRSTPIAIAAARMERQHIHRLVVVADDDETLPIGILSMTDLVHSMATAPRRAEPDASPDAGAAVEAAVAPGAPDAR